MDECSHVTSFSCDEIKEYIKDEHEASDTYAKKGLHEMSGDEARHAKFFEDLKKENGCND